METTAHWKLEWSDDLSMHNPAIDAEHKHFIALVNQMNEALLKRQEKADIEGVMQLILEDAIAHFAHEERLFAEKAYPKAREHAEIHASLLEVLRHSLHKITSSQFSWEWIDIGMSIKSALIEHITEEDTQYIDYLRTE